MSIKVKGETYESYDDLFAAIVDLTVKLEDMPSESPEYGNLAEHIADLRAGLPADFKPTPEENPDHSTAESPDESGAEGVELSEEVTTNIRAAYEHGLDVVCPTCGQHVDMPEAPPRDPDIDTCPNCNGWGQVVTGSRVDGHVWRNCSRCEGQGWVTKSVTVPASFNAGAASVPQAPGAIWNADTSRWDPPAGVQPPWAGAMWDNLLGKWG